MAYKYTLKWEKQGKMLVLPCKIENSVSRDYGFKAHLICPECQQGGLRQVYICENCGKQYTKSEINMRIDEGTGIIFDDRQRKEFLKQNIKKEIIVEEEIDLSNDILYNIEFVEATMEIFSADEYNEYIAKIHKYLHAKNKALIVSFGWQDSERGGLIIPARDKLLLILLRDYRLIKKSKVDEIQGIGNGLNEKLKAYSENKKADMYMEFLEKIQQGEKIEVQKERRKEETVIEADWLEVET